MYLLSTAGSQRRKSLNLYYTAPSLCPHLHFPVRVVRGRRFFISSGYKKCILTEQNKKTPETVNFSCLASFRHPPDPATDFITHTFKPAFLPFFSHGSSLRRFRPEGLERP